MTMALKSITCVLICILFFIINVNGKHYLIETEDNKNKMGNDYAELKSNPSIKGRSTSDYSINSPKDQLHNNDTSEEYDEEDYHSGLDEGDVEEDGFGKILENETERKEREKNELKILLGNMDKSKDGNIDRKELQASILNTLKPRFESEYRKWFEFSDIDGDGFVTLMEYKHKGKNYPRSTRKDGPIGNVLLFPMADRDGDGKLNVTEFKYLADPGEDPKMGPHVLELILKEKDTDGNGELSLQEFLGNRSKGKDKEWLKNEKDEFHNLWDKNKDDSLGKEEILFWEVPSSEQFTSEKVDIFFSKGDKDKNGKLSFQEVLAEYDFFWEMSWLIN